MNLAQTIEYDLDTRCYRIACPEQSQWGAALAQMRLCPRNVIEDSTPRRAMRRGGEEVIGVLRSAGVLLSDDAIEAALPHVNANTLKWRLCHFTARGDILRFGRRGSYSYGLPGVLTTETT